MCGWTGRFEHADGDKAVGSDFRCGRCSAQLRYRDEASVLVDEFGRGVSSSLDDLLGRAWFADVSLLYVGVSGPLRKSLTRLGGYVESTIEAPEGKGAGAVRRSYQDLQHLGFADASFDVVFSSHVMEHVPDPELAFDEARRVLRPGGRQVFSVPLRPIEETRVRCEMRDGELVHLMEPHYHRSPQGGALVVNDFGGDLVDRLAAHGFDATIRRPTRGFAGYLNAVVTAKRN